MLPLTSPTPYQTDHSQSPKQLPTRLYLPSSFHAQIQNLTAEMPSNLQMPRLPGDFTGWHSKTLYFLSSNFVTHNIASCPDILAVQDDPKVSLLGGHMTKAKAALLAV